MLEGLACKILEVNLQESLEILPHVYECKYAILTLMPST
jgi:hypothetical protein